MAPQFQNRNPLVRDLVPSYRVRSHETQPCSPFFLEPCSAAMRRLLSGIGQRGEVDEIAKTAVGSFIPDIGEVCLRGTVRSTIHRGKTRLPSCLQLVQVCRYLVLAAIFCLLFLGGGRLMKNLGITDHCLQVIFSCLFSSPRHVKAFCNHLWCTRYARLRSRNSP